MSLLTSAPTRKAARRCRQQGVALIITLIMLAVITFMAVTFLVLSHRERGSVSTNTDQTTAGLAADTALERAKMELLARMFQVTNDQNFDLMVSTNYINYAGFQSGLSAYTNVCYYDTSGKPLAGGDFQQNIANLYYNPRPPVFVMTNRLFPNSNDFRYYLDLNRNGRYDTNGIWPVISPDATKPYYDLNGNLTAAFPVMSNFFIGDPEWIGILEYPDRPHSATNKFLARYAYLVAPAGKTLDVNYIHNDAALGFVNGGDQPFRRNMGVGTWEINLAAFLADLNTNEWGLKLFPASPNYYEYLPLLTPSSIAHGYAFDDAQAFLDYRYGYGQPLSPSWKNLYTVSQLFSSPDAVGVIQNDYLDEFGSGPFMTTTALPVTDGDFSRTTVGWPGSDNANHYFTPQEFFDPKKTSQSFTNRLLAGGTNIDSYDRYTFYRMLAQLGTDSSPDLGKMNVNYLNVTNGAVVPGMETNLYSWTPLDFFTNAASRMFVQLNLRDGYGNLVTVTNIPFYPTNYYTPAVHRVLQLAANMFEATTNVLYPSIYRPYFSFSGTNIYISGYELVNGPDSQPTASASLAIPVDLDLPASRALIVSSPTTNLNVYGAPWVIGARKGFPNLNEITMQSVAQISRKMQVTRPNTSTTDFGQYQTAQLILIGISNVVGVEVWNSYRTNYPYAVPAPIPASQVYIQADGDLSMTLTNDAGFVRALNYALGASASGATNIAAGQWQGTGWVPGQNSVSVNKQSFLVPLLTNVVFLPDSAYQYSPPGFVAVPTNNAQKWTINPFGPPYVQPRWGLNITNRIRCLIIDGGLGGRVIDYVQLSGMNSFRDLSGEIYTNSSGVSINNMWSTLLVNSILGNMPAGMNSQINISEGQPGTSDADWANSMPGAPSGTARTDAIDSFRVFLHLVEIYHSPNTVVNTQLVKQVPYTPTSKRYLTLNWQANDPLVHYTIGDLTYLAGGSNTVISVVPPSSLFPGASSNFWRYTDRYAPWGGKPTLTGAAASGTATDPDAFNLAIKDPLVRASDDWDFPVSKSPNIGWLGRVHRGTPWQTVYLKAADITTIANKTWLNWTGDSGGWGVGTNGVSDSYFSRPVADRRLFDLFTVAINDNATRGQLSVNQTNLAAWSAVLSGIIAITNSSSPDDLGATPPVLRYDPLVLQPAGVYNPTLLPAQQPVLVQLVQAINSTRTNTLLFPNQVFTNVSDILATPQLTENSPFLNLANLTSSSAGGISDEVMERIPQQIMSLLTLSHSPRFVVYSYGQTLKPADHSLVTSGGFIGLCTNYQVTAEIGTRAVVRVDGSFDPNHASRTNMDAFGHFYPPHVVLEQFNVLPPD